MNEETKVYVPRSSAKEFITRNDNQIFSMSFKADEMIAFIKKHSNERGYLRLKMTKRKQPGQYGDTHCIWLDQWEPEQSRPQRTVKSNPVDNEDQLPY